MSAVITLDDVAFAYPGSGEILSGVDLRLESGEFRYVIGPSGAGKTSLLRLMYLGLRPTSGRLYAFGRDAATIARRDLPALRRRIGVVFQDCRLLPGLDVFDNVALPLRIAGADRATIERHVGELLDWVGLGRHHATLPAMLSGGEQQRVAIARAVIGKPDLLIADEPTGNVDDAMAQRLLHLFEELNRNGTAVVLATHNHALLARRPHPHWRLSQGALVGPAGERLREVA